MPSEFMHAFQVYLSISALATIGVVVDAVVGMACRILEDEERKK